MTMQQRFLINDPPWGPLFRAALAADVASARLSRAYRLYYMLRPFIPLVARQFLQSRRKVEIDQHWYVQDAFLRRLAEELQGEANLPPIVHPWPDGAQFGFVLTHDVETSAGMHNIARVAQIEERLGLRSSWNIVPYKYRIDEGLLADLRARGFEIGIHGYNHDGKLYCSQRVFRRRAAAINRALERHQAVGFRSPMVHRHLNWLQQLNVEYDASCFDIDPFQAMPGGVASLWPLIVGKFVELPYTLPQDHTLFVVLGHTSGAIWRKKLETIVSHNGMALMLTHPDYLQSSRHLDVYRRFLEDVLEWAGFWHALPRQVAAWWQQREQTTVERESSGNWGLSGPAAARASVARPAFDGERLALRSLPREIAATSGA